jgi:hypothetical protein
MDVKTSQLGLSYHLPPDETEGAHLPVGRGGPHKPSRWRHALRPRRVAHRVWYYGP